jgi:DNA-binding transcriptional LysR family regulator
MYWDDVRYFVEVARGGSTMAAARTLAVSQPTVGRRISVLEEALGLPLFERLPAGYRLTEPGAALLAAGEEMAAAAARFAAAAAAQARGATGVVRLTTSQVIADLYVAPMLVGFCKRHPDIQVQVFADDRIYDLEAGEADVAIRAAPRPAHGALIARRLAVDPLSLFCSRGYAAFRGAPTTPGELDGHAIVLTEGALTDAAITHWLKAVAPSSPVTVVSNTVAGAVAQVRAGLGVGAMPVGVFRDDPDLVECFSAPPEVAVEVWLLAPERLRDAPRVRALLDHVVTAWSTRSSTKRLKARSPA